MRANMNQGEHSVLQTQIVDWCWTPAVLPAASSPSWSGQHSCWPRFQSLNLRVNSWASLHRGCICCFIKTTSVCKSHSASWESTRYLPAPSAVSPPISPLNSQSEEIRVKCDYLMTLETISSKWKEHKRLLYRMLISRQRSHNVFTCEEKTLEYLLLEWHRGITHAGNNLQKEFSWDLTEAAGLFQTHFWHRAHFWHILCFKTAWMLKRHKKWLVISSCNNMCSFRESKLSAWLICIPNSLQKIYHPDLVTYLSYIYPTVWYNPRTEKLDI